MGTCSRFIREQKRPGKSQGLRGQVKIGGRVQLMELVSNNSALAGARRSCWYWAAESHREMRYRKLTAAC